MLRYVEAKKIEKVVEELCFEANIFLRSDVEKALKRSCCSEKKNSISREMMEILLENARIARRKNLPICQDTGVATVFVDIGQNVVIKGGLLRDAVTRGVKASYEKNCFRKSVVEDPLIRKNTGTNTPCIMHMDIVKGDRVKISVMPKGFGSENKSRIKMMNPTSTDKDIVDFCVETVKLAGPDACPPFILGIGIGGTTEYSAYLAKKALLRPVGKYNPKKHIQKIEKNIQKRVNGLKIGVMGLGGASTVLGVNIETAPTHIAGLPVAVNISCHALRSATCKI
ncbi:MAG: fumarate hydratase [Candidatus Omnitrophica bacterium]|nr:fumarate hydratase [Candidatus Omnitrophota bacterium]